ncbi:MAG: alkene reductase [Alphaproteobacteria bacterium]|nr:alkene reductase [Alphaproteobacteria bacterium]
MTSLFENCSLGNLDFKNRIFMAPLTRSRADDETDKPADMAVKYYKQRASAGLIISEATQVSERGKGYIKTPGIYTEEQAEKWKEITDAVHEEGGKIFLQLWHVGRISHTSIQPDGKNPVSASAIQADTKTFTQEGYQQVSMPEALSVDGIKQTIADFKKGAELAKKAGFDGVEIHGANGYLIDQFLRDGTNKREDQYGGSIENRARFILEIADAVKEIWPANRIGVRLSPTGSFNDMSDSNPLEIFSYVVEELNKRSLGYMHIVERFPGMDVGNDDLNIINALIKKWDGFYIANGDYDVMKAKDAIKSGHADAVAFGRPFISNPDLPERLEKGAEFNEPDEDTFYGGGAEGYIDYPFLSDNKKTKAA